MKLATRLAYLFCHVDMFKLYHRVHSSVVRAADCRSAGPWLKYGCALLRKEPTYVWPVQAWSQSGPELTWGDRRQTDLVHKLLSPKRNWRLGSDPSDVSQER